MTNVQHSFNVSNSSSSSSSSSRNSSSVIVVVVVVIVVVVVVVVVIVVSLVRLKYVVVKAVEEQREGSKASGDHKPRPQHLRQFKRLPRRGKVK